MRTFENWKTVIVGGSTGAQIRQKFKENRIRMRFEDAFLSKAFRGQLKRPQTIGFVLVRGFEIGIVEPTDPDEVLNSSFLEKFSLALCEKGDAFYLRLAIRYQRHTDWFSVGMRPIPGRPFGTRFFLSRYRGQRTHDLGNILHCPDYKLGPDGLFIFRNIPPDFEI